MGSKYGTNHLNDPWNSTTHNRVPQSRGVHWLTQWWKPWRLMWPQVPTQQQHTAIWHINTHSSLKKNNFAQPHAQRCVLQMHEHRLVELYQGRNTEAWRRWTGGGSAEWEGKESSNLFTRLLRNKNTFHWADGGRTTWPTPHPSVAPCWIIPLLRKASVPA